MEIIFLGSFFPQDRQAEISNFSRGPIANANNAFQHALLSGLYGLYPDMYSITAPNIGAYPKRYRKPFFLKSYLKEPEYLRGLSIGFCNITVVKHISRYLTVKRELSRILSQKHDNVCIISYDLHLPFMLAISKLKSQFPLLKSCVIIPDLPNFTNNNPSPLFRGLTYLANVLLDACYARIDGFVLLSKNMAERIPIMGKPWTVVEGIFLAENLAVHKQEIKSKVKTIFYAGSLDSRNGIMRLVKSFERISHSNYRLVICGAGDTEQNIKAAAATDDRIDFKGQLPRSEVLALQKTATLIVNPRTPEGEFTRYSFPSKTMEYLASSTPLLMHRLEGVPESYFNFCYTIDDLGINYLAEKILEICESDPEDLRIKAAAAKRFVTEQKCPNVQCKKIGQVVTLLMTQELRDV